MSYMVKRHDRAVSRKNDYRVIERKRRILKGYKGAFEGFTNEEIHRLAKGKIHCSCPMCSSKTKTHGWKHSDKVKLSKGQEGYS